jgi:hypothetical protein
MFVKRILHNLNGFSKIIELDGYIFTEIKIGSYFNIGLRKGNHVNWNVAIAIYVFDNNSSNYSIHDEKEYDIVPKNILSFFKFYTLTKGGHVTLS